MSTHFETGIQCSKEVRTLKNILCNFSYTNSNENHQCQLGSFTLAGVCQKKIIAPSALITNEETMPLRREKNAE